MKHKIFYLIVSSVSLLISNSVQANLINANPGNYTTFLNILVPGDTLYLSSGIYTGNLTLNGINGTLSQPIVIMGNGNSTIFQGQSCCNTVSITQSSYLIIKSFQIDGQNLAIDAVKAEGTSGNWAHHITIEYLNIINYGSSQQNVGISTKCPAWNWTIRKNIIIGAGTGMYLGNSPGDKPFVNGIIEYNYIAATIGYNIEIKHQLDTVRNEFAGTAVDGKTIIRHNVFTKDSSSSTGGNARPNLLVGGFPPTGWGSNDYYEIYGNFFYNNPVEALFQGTGNIMLYENIFVNHFDPSGFRAVYITPQNGISPQDIKIFHNTVWALNSSGGIRLYNPNTNYQQYCYGNAVFSTLPITNITNSIDNITDSYTNAGMYVISATANINSLNLYPQSGQLMGTLTSDTLFHLNTAWERDFNGEIYNWIYRGAYSGCCTNNGWVLQLDTMATIDSVITTANNLTLEADIDLFPNPVIDFLFINSNEHTFEEINIYSLSGELIYSAKQNSSVFKINLKNYEKGVYLIRINTRFGSTLKKIIKL